MPERSLWLGAVREPLPAIPAALARFACRNNQLALAALESIGAEVARRRSRASARSGSASWSGTSTSGVGDAEAAIAHRERTGVLAHEFHYDQLEFGGLARFVAEAARRARAGLLALDGVLVGRARAGLGALAAWRSASATR